MTARPISRAAFLASLTGAALLAVAPLAHAARNASAEQYVQTQGNGALASLSDRSLSPAARQQAFGRLMGQLADVPRIANFVLGRYGAQLRADAALRNEWTQTFQNYAMAVYEDQLDRYRGNELRVTGSVERVPNQDVIVRTEIAGRGQQRPLPVQWRLLRRGEAWKVVDVSVVMEGNEIWLAQQQQRDFLAQLDRNNGDIRALMASVRETTATMRQRITARAG